MVELPQSRLYYITVEEMNFTVTETLRASRVEKWIRAVKQRFLDAAPIKCVWAWTVSSPALASAIYSMPPSFNSRWRPRFWSS
jgi:hypothetical protein